MIPKADHSVLVFKCCRLQLLDDDRIINPLGILARALLSAFAEEIVGALPLGHYC